MITKAIVIAIFWFTAIPNVLATGIVPSKHNELLFPKEFDEGLAFSINSDKYIRQKFTSGHLSLSNSRFVDAMEFFTEGLRLASAVHDSLNTGLAYSFISLTHTIVRNNAEALQNALEANNYLSAMCGQEIKIWNLICLGSAYLANNYTLLAKNYLEQALSLSGYSKGFTQQYIIYGLENLAYIKIQEGDYIGAEQVLQSAIQNNMKETNTTCGCYYKLGLCQMELGKISEAHNNFQIAKDMAIRECNHNLLVKLYIEQAKYFRQIEQFERSSFYFALADSINKCIIEQRVNDEVQQVTIGYQNDIERQKSELFKQSLEIERLHLHEKTNRLKTTLALLLFAITSCLALLMHLKRKSSSRIILLQREIVRSKEMLLTNYIAGQEEERNRIARDLHDGIGSQLAVLKMQLSQLLSKHQPQSRDSLCSALSLCDEIYGGLRNVAFNLMPRTLVREGLISALHELTVKLTKSSSIEFNFNNFGVGLQFPANVESALFRITQEITANIVKHSKARIVSLDISTDNNSIGLTISWDGPGFDPKKLEHSKGFGWKNINTRLNQVGGTIIIDSAICQNFTTIMVEIPLKTKQTYGKAC